MAVTKGFKPRNQPLPKSEESTEGANISLKAGARLAERAKKYTAPEAEGGYKPYYSLRKDFHFTAAKKEIFIFTLAEIGTVPAAAEAAGISTGTAYQHHAPNSPRFDPDFAEAWDDAIQEYNASVEREIHERAINGWQEPVFGGKDKDEVVGHITKKSERLLTVLAKRRMPKEYGDKVELTKVGGTGGSSSTEIAPGVDLTQLSEKQRKKLKEFLTAMDGVDRSEVIDIEAEEPLQIEDNSEG